MGASRKAKAETGNSNSLNYYSNGKENYNYLQMVD
jgi:hypothetical protein